MRHDPGGSPSILVVINATPTVHYGYRVGVPEGGRWVELLNTDAEPYGGSGLGNLGGVVADDQPWHLARTKEHPSEPMTVDDALFQMELVGHDFYLFLDKDSGRPSVVYRRRKGYDYGVISLAPTAE